jgi:hypothetical protein
MRGRDQLQVVFSRSSAAASLWDYSEDALAERALLMSDEDLACIQRIAATYEHPDYPLPMTGQRITHNHVTALASIAYFEGRLRPLTQTRRRPAKDRPAHLEPQPPDPRVAL